MGVPGQPVADLDAYMNMLDKKQQGIQKMIAGLETVKNDQSERCLI